VPVYNVALPLMRKTWPDGPGFRLIEIDPERAVSSAAEGESAGYAGADRRSH
jgi:hypothetical protein